MTALKQSRFVVILAVVWLALFCISIHPEIRNLSASPTGDEPHYYVMMDSLVNDFDLDVRNNYEEIGYSWVPRDQRHLVRLENGDEIPLHRWGLPVLFAPIYALAGYLGVMLVIGLAVLCSVWLLCWREEKNLPSPPQTPLHQGLLFGCSAFLTPTFILASQAYPETIAFCVISLVIFLKDKLNSDLVRVAFASACIFLVSTLHEKLILAIVPVVFAYSLDFRLRLLFWVGAISGSAWILLIFGIYGFDYLEFQRGAGAQYMNLVNIPRNILLLLFDQRAGLLWFFPLSLLCRPLMKVKGVYIGFLLMPYLLMVLAFREAHGGFCPPGRYLVPIYPFILIGIIQTLSDDRLNWAKLVLASSAFCIFVGYLMMPGIVYPHWSIPNGYLHYVFGVNDSDWLPMPEFRVELPILSYETMREFLRSVLPASLLFGWILHRVRCGRD